ncbi:MAG: cytochrome c biogenesis protein CcsA [Hydrogenophaga sp.]|jgi:ABC-type transport system involved in cytochrome c biogenesis permease subunit|nr:cytochrome c biogenesis protein CcsA [Hydrogenophaga sp.]
MAETATLWMALIAYASLAALALPRAGGRLPSQRHCGTLLAVAVALHTASLSMRWSALGHGPFTTMHEILSSNLWSLSLVLLVSWWVVREVRPVVMVAMPVLLVLAFWLLMAPAGAGHLPATYDTPLLYIHTVVGKIYLGLLLVAVALGGVPLLRKTDWGHRRFSAAPDDARLDQMAHRFAAFAFVFDGLMLIVGAVWAQDAWGRYWAWDPLETWAFFTWLALATALHARATLRPAPALFGAWLLGVFTLAFLTFFGVPFLSTAPHKGAI